MPASVRRIRTRGSATSQTRQVRVAYRTLATKPLGERLPVEVRVTRGVGEAAHVDQAANSVRSEKAQELLEGSCRVPDGEDKVCGLRDPPYPSLLGTRRSSSSTIAAVLPVMLARIRRATSHKPPLLYVATLPGRDLPRALARLRCCECTIPPVGYINEVAHRSGGDLMPPNPFSHRTIFSGSWDDPGTAAERPRQRLQVRGGPAHGTRSERTVSRRPP